ncbi:MAG: hypothetical protein M1831_007243 [Alyxoria varia]|nr:MAG: hypothetical protein M1831_007243 [Alyxoria varia]
MAPDLNSVPTSPRPSQTSPAPLNAPSASPSTSRRPSQAISHSSHASEQFPGMPQRHSRPMTPAELHLELEKEQEAMVNRLTRELSQLRAHSASVTSNASSSSANTTSVLDPHEPANTTTLTNAGQHMIQAPTNPTAGRRHRSSSSLSNRTRSLTSSSSSFAQPPSAASTAPAPGVAPLGSTSQASVDRARDAAGLSSPSVSAAFPNTNTSRSRHNSTALPNQRSTAPSPSRPRIPSRQHSHNQSVSPDLTQQQTQQAPPPRSTPHAHPAQPHYPLSSTRMEETANARGALETARAENDRLVDRVKELEKEVRALKATSRSSEHQVDVVPGGGGATDRAAGAGTDS